LRRAHRRSADRYREWWARCRFAHPTRYLCPPHAADFPLIRPLQPFDVELDHPEHGLHRALRAGGIGAAEIFWQRSRHDLPRYAVAILQPAALFSLAAVRQQRVPEPINLGLIGAVDLEGDCVRVFHLHAAVQRHETLAGQREIDHQNSTGLSAGAIDGVALDFLDPRIGQ